MKQLTCEMCGSTDLLKQDGMFVCQNCGTKYTVDEAKKLMVEGTVKIDNSEKLRNLYTLARQAKDSNDAENAVKYYDLIKQEDPSRHRHSKMLITRLISFPPRPTGMSRAVYASPLRGHSSVFIEIKLYRHKIAFSVNNNIAHLPVQCK